MSKPGKKGKGGSEKPRPILGRPGNNVKIGIVGLPNVGKSSFFNLLSSKQVPAENYAFCTIEPSKAQVAVPDKRFKHLCAEYKPKSEVPAVLTVWDIAGLVRGAHEGKGLGNEFLANISAIDGIFHMVRAFKDKTVEHVEGDLDPIRDIKIIADELRQKDLAIMMKKYQNMEKLVARTNDKKMKEEFVVVNKIVQALTEGHDIQFCDWTNKEIETLNEYNLFTAKPIVFLVNVSEKNWQEGKNKWIAEIQTFCKEHYPGCPVIPCSAVFESKINAMDETGKEAYLKESKGKSSIDKIIKAGYKALHLCHFFTAGEDEVRAWTIRKGTKAPQAAGVIHTDFEKGFICAEQFTYDDFKELGSEHEVKAKGKYMQRGRDYTVEDGDILFFKFGKAGK